MVGLNKKFIWAVLLGAATVLVISLLSDYKATMEALSRFDIKYLPIILGLTFMNYLLRFVKWNYLLKVIDVRLEPKQSFSIFLSGLAMSITPGKVGELLKSFLLKELKGVPISRSAPVILAERLSDGFALAILSLAGMWYFQYGKQVVITVMIMLMAFIVLLQFPVATRKLIKHITNIPFLRKFENTIFNLLDSTHQLFKPLSLLFIVGIGVVSWFFECLAFYFVFLGLDYTVSLLVTTFTLSFSGIVGALTMLPGGLGATEGSLLGLLVFTGISRSIAAVATILIRFSTLWFGVLVGLIALISNREIFSTARKFQVSKLEKDKA